MKESEFKNWFRNNWDGWIESYEPRAGSGMGIPDLQVMIDGRLLPIELKVGEVKDGVLFPSEVRPAQIGWHKRFWDAGGISAFVVGVGGKGKKPDSIYVFCGLYSKHWDFGYEIVNLVELPAGELFSSSLSGWFLLQTEMKRSWLKGA